MKKYIGLFLFISTLVMAINFSGHQSINGLGNAQLFVAPVTGPYFIKGYLSLPMSTQGNTNSSAIALIYKNNSTEIYRGATGATGFSMTGLSLNASDSIKVSISSSATVDQGLNVIKGDVFFGNGL